MQVYLEIFSINIISSKKKKNSEFYSFLINTGSFYRIFTFQTKKKKKPWKLKGKIKKILSASPGFLSLANSLNANFHSLQNSSRS